MHPKDLLPDYALGLLSPEDAAQVERHIRTCAACRAELARFNNTLAALVDTLPATPPPPATLEKIQSRVAAEQSDVSLPPPEPVAVSATRSPRAPVIWLLAACMSVILAISGTLWGYRSHQAYQQAVQEQRVVASWLSQPEVETFPLQDRSGQRLGSVLLLPDGRALFVLREPPSRGNAYQAWGHTGEDLASLVVSERPVFEVPWQGFDALYLSLEPPGGSPSPTVRLGRVGL